MNTTTFHRLYALAYDFARLCCGALNVCCGGGKFTPPQFFNA